MRREASQLRFASVELIPSKALDAALRTLVRDLPEDVPVEVVTGSKEYPFHLTVLFTVISAHLSAEIGHRAVSAALSHCPCTVTFGRYRLFSDGSFVLLADKNPEVSALHRDIVNLVRTLPRPPRKYLGEYFTRRERERFLKIGDPYALEHFVPHITLARFAEHVRMKDIGLEIPAPSRQFRFSELRVRVWSDETSVARTIVRCRLGKLS